MSHALASADASLQPLVTTAVAAFLAAAVLTAALTHPLIGWLRDRQFGKAIRADGPDHAAKAGTPTMGGLAGLASIAMVTVAVAASRTSAAGRAALAIPLAAMLGFGALGLLDDLRGLARKSRQREIGVGLSARGLFACQALLAGAIWWWMHVAGFTWGLADTTGTAPMLALLAITVVAIVGTANGLNLSDGLDGLAAGLAAIAFAAVTLAIMRLCQATGPRAGSLATAAMAAACAGAALGFLVHNRHPARVFMGNVTSMALGAGLATLSLVAEVWPILPVVAAVLVLEVASDILQVAYFKATHGRRIFRMAPIHHHFELGGMHETIVVRRFWAAGIAAALAGLAIVYAFTSG